jgi:hypothetical protein
LVSHYATGVVTITLNLDSATIRAPWLPTHSSEEKKEKRKKACQ